MRLARWKKRITTGIKYHRFVVVAAGLHLRAAFKQNEALIGFVCVRFKRKPGGIAGHEFHRAGCAVHSQDQALAARRIIGVVLPFGFVWIDDARRGG